MKTDSENFVRYASFCIFRTSVSHSQQQRSRRMIGDEHLTSALTQKSRSYEIDNGVQDPWVNMSSSQMRGRKSRKVYGLYLLEEPFRKEETNSISTDESALRQQGSMRGRAPSEYPTMDNFLMTAPSSFHVAKVSSIFNQVSYAATLVPLRQSAPRPRRFHRTFCSLR